MATSSSRNRVPLSGTHAALGALLRKARLASGLTTRQLGYASGHISNVEGGYSTPSRDLLDVYLRLGANRHDATLLFDQLSDQAIQAKESRRRRGRPEAAESVAEVNERTHPDDVRRNYRVERYDVEFDFNEAGAITRVSSVVAIRAVTRGTQLYYTGHSPDSTGRQKDLGFTVERGGVIELMSTSPLGAAAVYVRLERPIHPDDADPFELAYTAYLDGGDLAEPEIHYVTRSGVREHRVTARFNPPALPVRVWWLAASSGFTADKVGPHVELPLSEQGTYSYYFDRIVPGWTYGLAWQWPAELLAKSSAR